MKIQNSNAESGTSSGNSRSKVSTLQITISGKVSSHQIRVILHEGVVIRIGRTPPNGIYWDLAISREHADLCWEDGVLRATCLSAARNPIVYRNETTREAILLPGESFIIGQTTFQVGEFSEQAPEPETIGLPGGRGSASASGEHTYSADDLRKIAFRDAEQQMELLARLPGMISEADSDAELGQTLCGLLMEAIPQAEAVAVAHYDMATLPGDEDSMESFPEPLTLRVQTRTDFSGRFHPSRRIIVRTLRQQASVLHIWRSEAPLGTFTISEGLGWAVCAPIRGESSKGWCMYVSGKEARGGGLIVSETDLAADLRFTELVAQFIGSVRQVRSLQEQKTRLNSFFSPKVIDSLTANNGQDALSPAERNITVLFCDVRGFSRKSERLQHDLMALLQSVSAALGVMVDGILERDGAVADFQGDAALGFWGWPVALKYGPLPACRAALGIFKRFRQTVDPTDKRLEGFSVGIGIAHGRAVAGQIGTDRHSKIGVFGPVVNQGSRLEGMTKQFGVSICIDGATAEFVERYFSSEDGRLRRLARVRPQGMTNPLDVFQLLPAEEEFPETTRQMIADYEAALEAVVAGQWDRAKDILSRLPEDDGPRQFLDRQLAEFDNTSPPDWDGTFSLARK